MAKDVEHFLKCLLAILDFSVESSLFRSVHPKCPSTEEWIRNMYFYTIEYYTVENNDIMKIVGKLIELERIILSEVTQTQKDNYHMYSLISDF